MADAVAMAAGLMSQAEPPYGGEMLLVRSHFHLESDGACFLILEWQESVDRPVVCLRVKILNLSCWRSSALPHPPSVSPPPHLLAAQDIAPTDEDEDE